MMPEYKSMVYYHEGKPKWHETFKVSDWLFFFGGGGGGGGGRGSAVFLWTFQLE